MFSRKFHDPHGLAIAFRMSAPVTSHKILFGVAAFLVANDADDFLALPFSDPCHDGPVIAETPIPVDLKKIRGQIVHIVERVRTQRVTCHLHALPRGKIVKNILNGFFEFFLSAFDLPGKVNAVMVDLAEFVNLFFHLHNRPFKGKAGIKNITRAKLDLFPDFDRLGLFSIVAFFFFIFLGISAVFPWINLEW